MFADPIFRLRSLFRRGTVEADLDDELRFHAERHLEKYLKLGMARDEGLRRVRLEFGGLDQVKEECRDERGTYLLETMVQDIRYGLRTLSKSPGFTAVALFTLALGIGANTAIFSVVYGVLLRPLPFEDPSRLVVLNETTPKVGNVSVSYPNFLDWRAQNHSFAQMAAIHGINFNLGGVNQPENIDGQAITSNFLATMGVRPILGRGFDSSEDKPGAAPVAILSYSLWQSHFGADPNAIGRVITLDGRGFTIVGVLPADFRWTERTDLLEPFGVWAAGDSGASQRGSRGDMLVVGRLATGVSLGQARAEMEGIAARLAQAYPGENDQFGVALSPVRESFTGNIRPAILVLFGAVVFVLFVACANIANLFLMRGAGRAREIALRIAIGASRGRIVRQILAESLIIASFGAAGGLGLAMVGIRGIVRLIPADTLMGANIGLNGAVLFFSGAIAILSMFLFGLGPALHSTRANVQTELKEGGKSASGSRRQNRWRSMLAGAEVGLALVLLAGAGLMGKSLYRLLSVNPGFEPDRVLKMNLTLRTTQYKKDDAILNFWQQTLDGVRVLPGVQTAALGTALPLTDEHRRSDITIEGMVLPKPGSFPHPDVHIVSPGYVRTMGLRLLRGREFSDADRENALLVGVINASLAQRYFPNDDPVGKRFMFGRPSPKEKPAWIEIIGVVADTKMYGLANPSRLEVYLPFRQEAPRHMTLAVKTASDPALLTSAIRAVIASLDKDQPIAGIATMNEVVAESVATPRTTLILLSLFSLLAVVLAAIGIYGVISYSVAQRTREIGIRMALGAQRADVLRLILAQGAKIAGAGIAAGAVASLALTRLMENLLFSVSASDPSTFVAVAAGLGSIAMVACYIPARRILRLNSLTALRYE
jgi:putative ABC transport system permease protein